MSDPDVAARREWKQLRGAGRGQEELCADNHTPAASAPHPAAPQLSASPEARDRLWRLWGRAAGRSARISDPVRPAASAGGGAASDFALVLSLGGPHGRRGAGVLSPVGNPKKLKRGPVAHTPRVSSAVGEGRFRTPASPCVRAAPRLGARRRLSPILTAEVPHLPEALSLLRSSLASLLDRGRAPPQCNKDGPKSETVSGPAAFALPACSSFFTRYPPQAVGLGSPQNGGASRQCVQPPAQSRGW